MAFGSRFPFIFTPGVPSTQPFIFTTGPVGQPFIFQTDNSRAGQMIMGNANFMGFYNDLFTANRNLNVGWAGYGGWGSYGGFGF